MTPLIGCATTGPATECENFRPIFVSHEDVLTPETARQILRNNEVWAALCDG